MNTEEIEVLKMNGKEIEVLKWIKYEDLSATERLKIDRMFEEAEKMFEKAEKMFEERRSEALLTSRKKGLNCN